MFDYPIATKNVENVYILLFAIFISCKGNSLRGMHPLDPLTRDLSYG